MSAAFRWLGRVTPRQFAAALTLLILAVSLQYTFKVLDLRNGKQDRSAILRWREQLLQLDAGENIYARFTYPNPPIMALMLRPLADLPPLAGWKDRAHIVWKMTRIALGDLETTEPAEASAGQISHVGYNDLAGQMSSALDQFEGVSLVGKLAQEYRFNGEGWLLKRSSGVIVRGGPPDATPVVDGTGVPGRWLPDGARATRLAGRVEPGAIRTTYTGTRELPRLAVSVRNIDSTTARARWARVVPRVMPTIVPRA